jgi:hypothetical protein
VWETLVLDFDTRTTFDWQHYAFKVSDAEFDGIFQRVWDEGFPYGSGPFSPDDMTINHRGGGRGFYFKDPNGHLLEVLTVWRTGFLMLTLLGVMASVKRSASHFRASRGP